MPSCFPRLFRLGLIEGYSPPVHQDMTTPRFPRLFRLGLIEGRSRTAQVLDRRRRVFPGFSAWASLKGPCAHGIAAVHRHVFPGFSAWASLKGRSAPWPCASWSPGFPRLFRLGLIEGSTAADGSSRKVKVFPGFSAWASLKGHASPPQ